MENTTIRLPKNFMEFSGDQLMSNFDHEINHQTANRIKGTKHFSRYAGWNFNGKVWWDNGKWNCEVWCYGSFQTTFTEDTLEEIMEVVCEKFGSD